jgi:hypothetical protein
MRTFVIQATNEISWESLLDGQRAFLFAPTNRMGGRKSFRPG